MKLKKFAVVLIASIGLSGCMTAGMLKDAGNEFEKGNYVFGTIFGAMSLVFGPFIDVFTLGGTLDSPEKVNQVAQVAVPLAVTAAAAQNSNAYGNTGNAYQAAAPMLYTPAPQQQSTPYVAPVTQAPVAAQPSQQAPQDPFVYSNSVNSCVVYDKKSIPGVANRFWRNSCSYEISITFCEIRTNNNECAKRIVGGETLKAGQSNYILKETQTIHYIACKAPYYLPETKLSWSGDRPSGRCQVSRTELSRQ